MKFNVLTIFPNFFDSFKNEALIARGIKKKLLKIETHNLRDWTADNHKTVDGRPYGGGAGMVMMVDPIFKAVKSIKKSKKSRIVLLSAKGKVFNQKKAQELSKYDQLTFICGRYEGVDERVARNIADEELSIGEYVLFGGEVATMVVMEAVSRLIPGVVAKEESIEKESFSNGSNREHPQYTRPDVYIMKGKKLMVPKVLLSGDHKKIVEWREKNSK
ncbi:MAG: tRNA (guanine-N(1)-)-methyltransferase [Candidatus Yanofskybacteria bacterium GW2011_GWF1_44_227]|uniref:tRNA (guanine-N(1)-)-methyltransferase n=1 Tax=Candidatus Yanofskybacteria bacterium GW2011_GWE2_40_11 TaxID=1619033 RepID=A0A0G0QHX2_9BACT|nr:MAG: tRNA (guanine-N(1)-)-methyltransferase [Candidatus Yanofskybacteria bacterium GW2011_GWE2_40_11]KKT14650.1 MAG: tRNA (guanine-N(1)-)-methyltransferase [Candidatus Yanofskybacteria bacterium GW2011_GWF2_43_596]KKT53027.1 MAG: tRNA (guanine-N(1)-)-methyltransferase [Candidatus Yanofskybacteria bacterium GW2011_GWF1_44_227]OGN35710.1 MAG: tRNA (guanosine(37)-N1)-methyltransferase TrmD [Candidatus Yanofskybacteria bacterium RIFOXYA2_FULL_45_28]OGN35748.1 MAG: tRNA (guanosine(37)-N1)-methylt